MKCETFSGRYIFPFLLLIKTKKEQYQNELKAKLKEPIGNEENPNQLNKNLARA